MKLIKILLVEDDLLDIIDIRRSLDKLSIHYQLRIVRNGEEAIEFLIQQTEKGILPDFVLIDMNMPKMNGLELLQIIRAHAVWRRLNCFVITTSDEPSDRRRAENLKVSGYIVKPLKLNSPSSMDSFNLMVDLLNH